MHLSNQWVYDVCQTCDKLDIVYPTGELGDTGIELFVCAKCLDRMPSMNKRKEKQEKEEEREEEGGDNEKNGNNSRR